MSGKTEEEIKIEKFKSELRVFVDQISAKSDELFEIPLYEKKNQGGGYRKQKGGMQTQLRRRKPIIKENDEIRSDFDKYKPGITKTLNDMRDELGLSRITEDPQDGLFEVKQELDDQMVQRYI